MPREWFVYILQCANGTFYTGMSADPILRLDEHNAGLDPAAYTFTRRPVRLVWAQGFPTRQEALVCEHQVKGWSRAKKAALIQGDWELVHTVVRAGRKRRADLLGHPPNLLAERRREAEGLTPPSKRP